ncbi:phosphatase PAP2 family protein [Hymenobacter sp. DG25B]|uniref:phosphatase PAP2 family protein n=1 Tax=Hymenobacter sp. DG25B TaxID=1385664 RepID=UPI0005C8DBCC|nr:phosphatase PAP2 family protein [Hymenobacter sp. DG25B]
MKLLATLFLCGSLQLAVSPSVIAQQAPSPYHTRFAVDAPITAGLGAVSGLGLYLISQKHGPSDEELAGLDRNALPRMDRFAAGKYSEDAILVSNILCYGSLAMAPGLLALNSDMRGRYGQVAGLYLESMSATAALFTMSAGTVYRNRPFLYGTEGPANKRKSRIATNSFFAGHTAHAATATFFAAKVFHDFHPDSPVEPFVWGAAAIIPAAVGYARIEAGKHFLTDNLVGYAVGATMGIVVPQLHKTAGRTGLSVMPIQGLNANGYSYGGLLLTQRL